ncbi:MAG: hypothetical protein CL582_08080 [Alteromonadaceae bacterium]|nr:hypothetical protein [Alteromonadaceae bacterium]
MSGSNSYTKEEVQARVEQLRAGAITLDRNKVQSATDLVTGVQDLIYKTLNSDVDSVYALLKLLANSHIILASKILRNLDLLERYAPVSRQADPTPDSDKLTRLIEITELLEFAGAGEREALLREYTQVTASFANSSVTSDGFKNSGISPTYARGQSVILAEETEFLINTLIEKIPNFQNALSEYSHSSLEPLSLGSQAKKATGVLKGYENDEDLSSAILDSVIFSSLLNSRVASKRDITTPKFEGTVETLPGVSAELYGGTKPFIIQDSASSAAFTVDSSSSATVSGAQSDAAELVISLSPELFSARGDYGELFTQTTANSTALQKWFSSSGSGVDDLGNPVITIPYLRSSVRPAGAAPNYVGGVAVNFSYWTWTGASPTGPSVDISCVDNGVDGTLIEPISGTAYGTVDYESGHILVKMPFPATLDSSITCEYGYYPLGTLQTVDITPGAYPPTMTGFGFVGAYSENTLTTETLAGISSSIPYSPAGVPSDWVTSAAKLGDLIQATGPSGWGFSHEVSGSNHEFAFSSSSRGSVARVAFPNYSSAELNTASPFAPTWTTNPTSLNQAIAMLYSSHGERFGADTQFSGITSSDASVSLTCPENTLFKNVPITAITDIGATLAIDLAKYSLSVGDSLRVRFDGTGTGLSRTTGSFHTKVVGIDLGEDEVTVSPPVSLPLDDGSVGLLTTNGTWTCDISRSRVLVRSGSTAASSSLSVGSVVGGGLGFAVTDAATGFSNVIKLLVDTHGTRPRDGYEIHPNDIVLESYVESDNTTLRVLGHVLSVNGDEITISLVGNTQPKVYPYGTLKIVSLGWYRFMEVGRPLDVGLAALKLAIEKGSLLKSTAVFAESGSGQAQQMSLLNSLKAAVDAVRHAYLGYSAHTVRTVDELLATLKQERLTLPLDMLMTARFGDLADMGVAEVSDQGNIDNLLLAAFDQLGGETDFFEVTYNADPTGDYFNRGPDDNYEADVFVENAGDLI